MSFTAFMDTEIFKWILLPLLIFTARVMDVSIGTVRLIFIARGFRRLAPILGFFEVLIWLAAIRQIMSNLTSPIYYIAYAGGFATGTYAGMYLEDKISIGRVMLRVITRRNAKILSTELRKLGHFVTISDAKSKNHKVNIIFTVIKRQELPKIIRLIKEITPHAYYSIEDVRFASEDKGKAYKPRYRRKYNHFLGLFEKRK